MAWSDAARAAALEARRAHAKAKVDTAGRWPTGGHQSLPPRAKLARQIKELRSGGFAGVDLNSLMRTATQSTNSRNYERQRAAFVKAFRTNKAAQIKTVRGDLRSKARAGQLSWDVATRNRYARESVKK